MLDKNIPTRLERQKLKEKWGEALGRLAGEIKGAIRPFPLRSSDELATSVRRPKWFEGNWLIQMVLRCGPTAATFPNRARTRPRRREVDDEFTMDANFSAA